MWQDAAKLLRGNEPGAGRIYYNRALALSAKGSKEEALTDIDQVVSLYPKLAPAYYTRAKIKFELKRYSEAMQDLDASIEFDSKYSAAYLARAMTLTRLGRDSEALQDLRKSCEMKDVVGCFAVQQHGKTGTPSISQ
jgi:tetratricopeptide (TPR) repeat protein